MTRRAVLLVNLGSPESPAVADVRRYLAEFLGDERVLDAPRQPWRWLLLHGIILRFRPAKLDKPLVSTAPVLTSEYRHRPAWTWALALA